MLVNRTFTRSATYLRKLHYSVPSHVDGWTQPSPGTIDSTMDHLVTSVENAPSTSRGSPKEKDPENATSTSPAIQQPYQIFQSWEPDSVCSNYLSVGQSNLYIYPLVLLAVGLSPVTTHYRCQALPNSRLSRSRCSGSTSQ